MIAIIVICFLALTLVALTFHLWQRPPAGVNPDRELAPPRFAGLFSSGESTATQAEANARADASKAQADLIDRARAGDLTTLSETHSIRDAGLYAKVLDAVIDSTSDSHERFRSLVAYISKSDGLRGNKRLADLLMAAWETAQAAPDRSSTIEMMHIAALSDDAELYQHAVELVIADWQQGKLSEFGAEELIELFDSQFWILAPEARRGGAGFALKSKLANVRRELATATPARP
jgi:hypothetical protein